MSFQMTKRMEALECIMEAYPSNLTLKEVKEQLESSILKTDKEIRELVKVKSEEESRKGFPVCHTG